MAFDAVLLDVLRICKKAIGFVEGRGDLAVSRKHEDFP
jgi:hypothetical protein